MPTCECGAEMVPCRVQIPSQPVWRRAYICLKCESPEAVLPAQPIAGYQAMPSRAYKSKFVADEAGADPGETPKSEGVDG